MKHSFLILFSILLMSSVYGQRINPATRIKHSPDSTENYFLVTDENGEYRHSHFDSLKLIKGRGVQNYLTMWLGLDSLGSSSLYQDGSNNFGFGTALPTTRVDINGGLRVRSITQDNSIDSVLVSDGSGQFYWRDASTFGGGSLTGTGSIGQVTYWSGSTALTGENNLFWDSANVRLGIGTNSPSYALDISSTGGMRIPRGLTSQRPIGSAGIFRFNANNILFEGHDGNDWLSFVSGSGSSNHIAYWDSASNLTGESSLYWDSTNNRLGVGTSSPSTYLTILEPTYNTADNNTSNVLALWRAGEPSVSFTSIANLKVGRYAASGSDAKTQLDFELRETSAYSTILSLRANGNTGINNTSPAYTLDISGTGGLRVPVGTSAQRPTGAAGVWRQNSDTGYGEYHNGFQWRPFGVWSVSGSNISWGGNGQLERLSLYDDNDNSNSANTYFEERSNAFTRRLMIYGSAASGGGGDGTFGFIVSPSETGAHYNSSISLWTRDLDNGAASAYRGVMSMTSTGDFQIATRSSGAVTAGDMNLQVGDSVSVNIIHNAGEDINFNGYGALQLHSGTTAQRPTGAAGKFRYNTTVGGLEYHNGTTWNTLGTGSVSSASNIGGGIELFHQKNGEDLEFKTLKTGLNMMLSYNDSTVTLTPQNDIYSVNGTLSGSRTVSLGGNALTFSEYNGLDSFYQVGYVLPDFTVETNLNTLLFYGKTLTDANSYIQLTQGWKSLGFDFGSSTYGLQYQAKGSANYSDVETGTPLIMRMNGGVDNYIIDYANGSMQLGSQSASPTGNLGAIHVDSDDSKFKFHNGEGWVEVQTDAAWGELYKFSATDSIKLNTTSPQKITGLTTGESQYFTLNDSTLIYTGATTRTFKVEYTGDVVYLEGVGDTATTLFYCSKNGTVQTKSRNNISRVNESSVNEKQPFGKSFLIQLAEDDEITWHVSGSDDIRLEDININITQL